MAKPVFLYPTLNDELKKGIFKAKDYTFSYINKYGEEQELKYEKNDIGISSYSLKTDGVWNLDNNDLHIRRSIAIEKYKKLFGPDGIACEDAVLGVSVVWTSPDSRQRGSKPIMTIDLKEENFFDIHDQTFKEGEINISFKSGRIREEINLSIILYIAQSGTPKHDETHLANEEGFTLGELDSFCLKLEGSGSLFPIFEVYEPNRPLWYVKCGWTDPIFDSFSETVSLNINTAHKNYIYINQQNKLFCPQLLVEVLSAALCCIIEKLRSEKYIDQILGEDKMEHGSVGEAVRYFADTLGWNLSTPEELSLSIRNFFNERDIK